MRNGPTIGPVVATDGDVQPLDELPTVSIESVRPGDLLFFVEDGWLRRLIEAVGDVWIHSAVAIVDEAGNVVTAEAGTKDTVFSRPLADVVDRYPLSGVARPAGLDPACVSGAAAWARDRVGGPQNYAWDDFLLAAVVVMTRRAFPPAAMDDLGYALTEVANRNAEVRSQVLTCSSFVHRAFEAQGAPCALDVPAQLDPRAHLESAGQGARIDLRAFTRADPAGRARILRTTSLLELLAASPAPPDRPEHLEGMYGSRVSADELANTILTVGQIVSAYLDGVGADGPADTDARLGPGSGILPGRWVSPTDLWRCPELAERAILRPD